MSMLGFEQNPSRSSEKHGFDSLQSKPPLAPPTRLRSSLQDSGSSRSRGKGKSDVMMKIDNLMEKRERSDAVPGEKVWSSLLFKNGGPIHQNYLDPVSERPTSPTRKRTRTRSDGSGVRHGTANAITGANKTDLSSGATGHSSWIKPGIDRDIAALPNDRRGLTVESDNERIIAEGSNRLNVREDGHVVGQSLLMKGKPSRAPRTGSAVLINTTSCPDSSGAVDEWDQRSCHLKAQTLTGVTNHKRPLPTRASSPSIAQWVGQRPQKISRGRRINVVSPLSDFEEACNMAERNGTADLGPNLRTVDSNECFLPKAISNNDNQSQLKLENVPSRACISQSEDCGTGNKPTYRGMDSHDAECGTLNGVRKLPIASVSTGAIKAPQGKEITNGVWSQGGSGRGPLQTKSNFPVSTEKIMTIGINKPINSGRDGTYKGSDNYNAEDRALKGAHKVIPFGLPTVKNKVSLIEETADGTWSQGRSGNGSGTGRGSIQTKYCFPPTEKSGGTGFSKPLNIDRPGTSDQIGRRVGGPLKVSDGNTNILSGQIINSTTVLTGESDDDWEELLVAANAARNASAYACKNNFWKNMEPLFAFPRTEDISHVKDQIIFAEDLDGSPCNGPDADRSATDNLENKTVSSTICNVGEMRSVKISSGNSEISKWLDEIVPLSQRLLSAFIAEDSVDELGDGLSHLSSNYSPYWLEDMDEVPVMSKFELDTCCNGFRSSGNFRGPKVRKSISGDEPLFENDVRENTSTRNLLKVEQRRAGTGHVSDISSEHQYQHISLDDRILMELQSIGLFTETVPDLSEGEEDINDVIPELQMMLYPQVRKKKNQMHKLEKAIQDRTKLEKRRLEQRAMDELVEAANRKLKSGCASRRSNLRSGASKAAKPLDLADLAFAKRTLARSCKFEETGQSCFSEPILHDAVFAAPDPIVIDDTTPETAANTVVISGSRRVGSRVLSGSRALASRANPETKKNGRGRRVYTRQLDKIQGVSCEPAQTFAKNDPKTKRGKPKEVPLDEIVTHSVSRAAPTRYHTSPSGVKQKRTEKYNRSSLNNGKGEAKTKKQPKQKPKKTQFTSTTGICNITESSRSVFLSKRESRGSVDIGRVGVKQEAVLTCRQGPHETVDRAVPLAELDEVNGVGLGTLGHDLDSWLNVDDDAVPDNELEFLSIPMDDLSDLPLTL